MFKYPNKRFCRYFSLKSCNICKSDAKLLNIEASVCVLLGGVDASLKNYLKLMKLFAKIHFPTSTKCEPSVSKQDFGIFTLLI